jgi:hypothetical protein
MQTCLDGLGMCAQPATLILSQIDYTALHLCVHTSIVMEALWCYFQKIIHIHFPYIQHAL